MPASVKTLISTNLQARFSALGDPTRYHIVKLLIRRPELCVSEVAKSVGISTAGISQHMKVLEQSGLVKPERMGQKTCYRLRLEAGDNQTLLSLIK